jgi:type I restriction enzyme, S subunit
MTPNEGHMARPFPSAIPRSEQKTVVDKLDALRMKVAALQRFQSEVSTELDAMLPAILDKAFRGEL